MTLLVFLFFFASATTSSASATEGDKSEFAARTQFPHCSPPSRQLSLLFCRISDEAESFWDRENACRDQHTRRERKENSRRRKKTLCKWPEGWFHHNEEAAARGHSARFLRPCNVQPLSNPVEGDTKPLGAFQAVFLAFGLLWSKISTPESCWCCRNASWWCNSHIIWGRNQPPALLRCVWTLKSFFFLDKPGPTCASDCT